MDRTICFRVSDIEYAQIAKNAGGIEQSPSGYVKQIFLRSMLGDLQAHDRRSEGRSKGVDRARDESGDQQDPTRSLSSGSTSSVDSVKDDQPSKSIYKGGYAVKERVAAWRSRGGFDELEHRNLCLFCVEHSCDSVRWWLAEQAIKPVLVQFCKCSALGCRHGEIAI